MRTHINIPWPMIGIAGITSRRGRTTLSPHENADDQATQNGKKPDDQCLSDLLAKEKPLINGYRPGDDGIQCHKSVKTEIEICADPVRAL